METKRLYRSQTDKILGGVCAGLGKYFGMDPTVVRLIFVVLTLFGASGVLLYLILWVVIPPEPELPGQSTTNPPNQPTQE
jgi:phage shock protein C